MNFTDKKTAVNTALPMPVQTGKPAKVLIAMSGGVDSAVAALLLQEQGYECIGCTMKLYDNEDIGHSGRTCCSLDDVEDARTIAYRLGIPYYVFNFKASFRETVMEKFISYYEQGLTPSPCIDCNRGLKFGRLFERSKLLGCDVIATGHYARIEKQDGRYVLKKALDETRDQSYFLYGMTQEQLAHTRFPLGDLPKSQVRQIAREHNLINAEKPDSQDICFVPDGDYAAAIQRLSGRTAAPGPFVDADGKILGTHRGVIHYTVGQRRGLGVSAPKPLYVCAISAKENTITLGPREQLFRDFVDTRSFHWTSGSAPTAPIRCGVKLRSTQAERPATVIPDGADAVRIVFDAPQYAAAPGQAAVLYDGSTVLGGGVICSTD